MTGKKDAAKFAARGLAVFPIKENAKHPPLLKDWNHKASSDPDQIEAWAKQYPNCNWGVHCQDLIVVDVDPRRHGDASFKNLNLTPTLTVATPGGGWHIYYHRPGGVKNSADEIAQGIDIKSNDGYVVAPGSHVEQGTYKVVRNGELKTAPDALVQKCRAVKKRETSDQREPPRFTDYDIAVNRAKEWLTQQAPAIEGEHGDAATFRIICGVRDFGVPRDRVLEALYDWNEQCLPPWSTQELQKKIKNAYEYAHEPAGVLAVESDFILYGDDDKELDLSILYGPRDISPEDIKKTDYLVKRWLPRAADVLLFGKWGAGKTFCALSLGLHIAAGKDWFGNRVRRAGVLYLNWEGSASMGRRLWALRKTYKDQINWEDLPFYVVNMRHALVTREKHPGRDRKLLHTAIAAFRAITGAPPKLIIIDTMRNALGGGESDTDLTSAYKEMVSSIIDKGATVLTVHHPGHGDVQRSRGDSGIEAGCDAVIRVDKDLRRIESKKQRDGELRSAGYKLTVVDLGRDEDGDPVTSCVAEWLEPNSMELTDTESRFAAIAQASVNNRVTTADFRTTGMDLPTIKAVLEQLVLKNQLIKDGKFWKVNVESWEEDDF